MKEALHQPQVAENNKVVGMKEVIHQELDKGRLYRSNFDPRLHCHRAKRNINDFDLDWLASITNGNCGLLAYTKREPNELRSTPNISEVDRYEEVVSCDFP